MLSWYSNRYFHHPVIYRTRQMGWWLPSCKRTPPVAHRHRPRWRILRRGAEAAPAEVRPVHQPRHPQQRPFLPSDLRGRLGQLKLVPHRCREGFQRSCGGAKGWRMEAAASPSGSQWGSDLRGCETVSAAAKLQNTDFNCLTGILQGNNRNRKKKKPFLLQLLSEVKGEKNVIFDYSWSQRRWRLYFHFNLVFVWFEILLSSKWF